MLNASGDQFFLPDSSQFYFKDLSGEKYLRYVPNASHSLEKTDALENLQAFYATVVKNTPRPQITWTFETDGSIKVVAKDRPDDVRVWQATNPEARNFRHDVIGSAYQSTPLQPSGPNTWVAQRSGATQRLDSVLRRDVVSDRRQVSVQGDVRRAGCCPIRCRTRRRSSPRRSECVVSGFSRTGTCSVRT